jgi:hypothetical protein
MGLSKKITLLRENAVMAGELCYTIHTYLSDRSMFAPIYKFNP